jgi:hypothetical protein
MIVIDLINHPHDLVSWDLRLIYDVTLQGREVP